MSGCHFFFQVRQQYTLYKKALVSCISIFFWKFNSKNLIRIELSAVWDMAREMNPVIWGKKSSIKSFPTCEDCIGVYKLCTVVMRQLRPEFKFPAKIEMDFSLKIHDLSIFDKRCSYAHFVSFLSYYYCTNCSNFQTRIF